MTHWGHVGDTFAGHSAFLKVGPDLELPWMLVHYYLVTTDVYIWC